MQTITINLYPIIYLLAFLAIISLLVIIVFLLKDFSSISLFIKKDIHEKDKDVEIVSEAFNKIGGVNVFANKNEKILNAQNFENNKEIFQHDKQLDEINKQLEFLLNEQGKLKAQCEILSNKMRGQ